jgi:hypothetical protein
MSALTTVVSIGSVALSGFIAAAAGPRAYSADSATGLGVMVFDGKEAGTGYFDFALQGGDQPAGSLVFGAEHDEGYPDFVIVLEQIDRLSINGKSFTLKGRGRLHDDAVTIRVAATDGNGTPNPDTFRIQASRGMNVLFTAEGEVTSGDIQVGIDQ